MSKKFNFNFSPAVDYLRHYRRHLNIIFNPSMELLITPHWVYRNLEGHSAPAKGGDWIILKGIEIGESTMASINFSIDSENCKTTKDVMELMLRVAELKHEKLGIKIDKQPIEIIMAAISSHELNQECEKLGPTPT